MKKLILILTSLFIFSFLSACDDDNSNGSNGGWSTFNNNEEFIEAYTHDFVVVFCDRLKKCPSPNQVSDMTTTECQDFFNLWFKGSIDSQFSYAFEHGASYNKDNYYQCFNEIQNQECTGDFFGGETEACTYIVKGTKQAGDSCSINEECAEGLYCDTEDQCPGSCVAYAQDGESCENTDCAHGLSCGNNEQCSASTAYAKAGESCLYEICEYGTSCNWNEQSPKCYTWLSEGESCVDETGTLDCKPGLVCNEETQKCEKIIFVNANEFCNDVRICEYGYKCNNGICAKVSSEGDSCDENNQCDWNSYCDNNDNKCHLLKSEGDSCFNDFECSSYKCENDKCGYDPCIYSF